MTDTTHPLSAATGFPRQRPTRRHRPALWEGILGTVYASDGHVGRYFDYDWAAARAYAGVDAEGADARLDRFRGNSGDPLDTPQRGTRVLFVLRED